jgi:hypothetical protein
LIICFVLLGIPARVRRDFRVFLPDTRVGDTTVDSADIQQPTEKMVHRPSEMQTSGALSHSTSSVRYAQKCACVFYVCEFVLLVGMRAFVHGRTYMHEY